jgi:Zn-dependent metalloprotease
MNKFLLIFLSFLALTTVAQTPDGFKRKKQSNSVKDANIPGFKTIDGSKLNAPNRFQSIDNNLRSFRNIHIIRDTTNQVIFIENLTPPVAGRQLRISATEMAMGFVEENKSLLRLKNPAEELSLISSETDENGITHLRMEQKYRGISIYGGELRVHIKDNQVTSLNGCSFKTPNISITPAFDGAKAIEIALRDLSKIANVKVSNSQPLGLLPLQKNTAKLQVYFQNKKPVLAYELTVRPNLVERWIYFVNAKTGEVIDKFNHTCTIDGIFRTTARDLNGRDQEFRIYEKDGTYFMVDASQKMFSPERSNLPDEPSGVIWTIDAKNSRIGGSMELAHVTSSNGLSWSPVAVSAHHNAALCYAYYTDTHNRNSLNGSGGNIVSVINIADEDGTGLDNAYWNGEFMGYGNGGQDFKPLAGSLDVAGHEMTHGVIENTARLEYRNQSGALNESFADIFGVLIDRDDWTLGEDVVKPGVFPSGALRSLQDPNQGGRSLRDQGFQPKNMSQYAFLKDTPDEDNGGVHINSGIPNHAFYLFTSDNSVGLSRAEKVYYQVITNYLTRTSKFIDLRLAVIDASKNMYGETVANAARKAFDEVGIVEGSTTSPQPDKTPEIPVNPGTESLVVYDPEEQTLYAGVFGKNNYVQIAPNYGCLAKPSVTDDGSFVYFVGKDRNIYRKNLRTSDAPAQISDNGSFRNVAISKDGKRLAALAAEADQFIYLFDLVNDKNVRFRLYNSTYTQGVSTDEVLYADSFEWGYTGEFLIYDAFNRAESLFGDVEFWDVGILQAWNPAEDDFGAGTIEKVFTNLERGDNIGNPALAKTNPNVVAFDYFNAKENTYFIVATNFDTGELKGVVENNDIGYPDYSKSDDKLAFNSLENSQSIVRGINMAQDRITPTGSPSTLFTDAKWAVWYAQGQRQLPTKSAQTMTFAQVVDQNTRSSVALSATASSNLPIQFTVKEGDATISGNQLKLGTTPGKVIIEAFQLGNANFTAVSAEQTFCIRPNTPTVSNNGTTLTAFGGQEYQWYINGNALGGQTTNPNISANFAGTYTVRAITADGCISAASAGVAFQQLLGNQDPIVNLKVYPNPTDNFLEIDLPAGIKVEQLTCFDAAGKEQFTMPFEHKISLQNLSAGAYLLKLDTANESFSQRFVKR